MAQITIQAIRNSNPSEYEIRINGIPVGDPMPEGRAKTIQDFLELNEAEVVRLLGEDWP